MGNFSRFCNPVLLGGFLRAGATNYSNGYLTYTTAATPGAANFGSFAFGAQLADVPTYTDFTNLYDQYRLNKIVFKIIPLATSVSTAAAPSSAVAQSGVIFHWVTDPDDDVIPGTDSTALQSLREKAGYRCRNIFQAGGRPITITYRPAALTPVLQAGGSTANALSLRNKWFDTISPNVVFFGVKCIMESVSSGAEQTFYFKTEAKYYISLKGVQ